MVEVNVFITIESKNSRKIQWLSMSFCKKGGEGGEERVMKILENYVSNEFNWVE